MARNLLIIALALTGAAAKEAEAAEAVDAKTTQLVPGDGLVAPQPSVGLRGQRQLRTPDCSDLCGDICCNNAYSAEWSYHGTCYGCEDRRGCCDHYNDNAPEWSWWGGGTIREGPWSGLNYRQYQIAKDRKECKKKKDNRKWKYDAGSNGIQDCEHVADKPENRCARISTFSLTTAQDECCETCADYECTFATDKRGSCKKTGSSSSSSDASSSSSDASSSSSDASSSSSDASSSSSEASSSSSEASSSSSEASSSSSEASSSSSSDSDKKKDKKDKKKCKKDDKKWKDSEDGLRCKDLKGFKLKPRCKKLRGENKDGDIVKAQEACCQTCKKYA